MLGCVNMSDPSLVRFDNMSDLCYLGLENMSDSSLLRFDNMSYLCFLGLYLGCGKYI
jgi:hypothetical protein